MNPQSQKVVESNLKLDSKNTRESKKIQRVKNTYDSTNSQKSKESSKVKTLIRTIPVSIALASALSSQAVALSTENGELVNEVIMSGRPTLTVNGTIKNGTIINGISTIKNNAPTSTNRGNTGGSIINGWDLKYSSWSTPGVIVNNSKNDNAGGVLVTGKFSFAYGDYGHSYEVLAGTKAGNLTFDTGSSFTVPNHGYGNFVNIISVSENASAATIANKGTIAQNTSANIINLASNSTTDAIVNSGTITSRGNNLLTLRANATLGILKNSGTMSTTSTNLVDLSGGNNSIEQIELSSGSTTSAGTNIINAASNATIGTITADNATINGGINLAGTSSITNGISLSNTSALTGNISLTNNSRIQGGIVLDNSKMTGGITLGGSSNIAGISLANASTITGGVTLNGSSSIDNISISGTNTTLAGNISLSNTSNITGGINVQNGGTITNNISAAGGVSIDSINITNGRVGGNISANWGNGGIGRINQITITGGEVGGNIALANETSIANGMTLNNGTINGAINLNIGTTDGSVASIPTISLQNASTIANITLGHSATNSSQGRIDSLTLGGTSSIGSIVNNRGTISNIALNGNSTITNGITNASGGTISNITLASSNTINNGIANEGNIDTIISNTGTNINNTITNHGTIGSLKVNNQGTIVYKSDSGIITDTLSVASGATLDIKNTSNNTGTIELKSDSATLEDGSTLNLANGSTLVGHLKNSGNLGDWTNYSNIQGHFINTGTIGILNAGSIQEYLENTGFIQTLKQGKITGTLNNTGTIGELNTSVINYDTNGNTNTATIAGAGHYGILNIDKDTIMDNNNTITNALKVDKNNSGNGYTLTINNGGSGNGTLYFNSTSGTIDNAGTILGSIDNGSNSTISIFTNIGTIDGNINNNGTITDFTNSGSISGTFTNQGHIVKFVNTNTGSINNFVNDKTISFFENNGIITSFNGNNGTIYGVINSKTITNGFENVATSLWNKENALIQGNVALKGDYKDCTDSGGTICKTSDLINEGTITGNVTNEAGKEINSVENTGTIEGSIANSGSINTFEVSGTIAQGIINDTDASISSITINEGANLGNSGIANNSNIGSLKVYESVKYTGNGSDRITQALEVAKDKTLTIGNSGTLSFNSKNGNVNNLGTIAGNLSNVKDSIITNFTNNGIITGNLYNDGHIDTLHNKGTMGTIYNTSKNTIKNLLNDKNSVIAGIDNSKGRYDLIQNQGTILGDIKNDNGTITNLVNTNSGTITGQIISNGNSNIGTIMNAGVINSSHTMNDSDIQNASNDAISLDTISNVVTAISNSGSINGNVRVAGNSEVDLIQNSKVIAGCIILEGGRIGNINNTNGAIANCMSFSNGASVDNLNNDGTIKDKITNDSGNITIDNSGSIGGITTSNGGTTNISNGGFKNPGGNIGLITNDGSNSTTNIIEWNVGNPDNPNSPIKVAGNNLGGINTGTIYVDVTPGKVYDVEQIVVGKDINGDGVEDGVDSKGDSLADQLNNGQGIFDSLHHASDIITIIDEGGGEFSAGLDTQELSGKTLGASLIYSSRMRQIDTNNMLKEINVKNFKTDFEILEQRERLKNQQALLENYKQQRESYLNGLTKDNKELKRVSSKESTSLSTYANNSNIKSDAIEVVDYYNKDTLASLDNLQATTKANQETYSNLDLLRELDDIFISHTGDKDNLYTFALPYTRYTSAQLDGGVGTLKSHASGILAGAQAKLPSERGILGIYFGYESSDKQVGQQRLDFDEKVYYGGLTYYNVFARKGVSEYYLSANTRIDKGDTDLYKTYRSGSTTINSQVDSYGYGADLKVGANYYNIYNNSVLSPEIGISYQGISTDSFRLRHLGGVSEHYYTQDVNFFDISASLRWQRAWNNVFKTMASLGAMYNVYNDAKGSGVIAGLKQSADINVEELYGTTQVGISYALGENANIALNYSGIFANGVQSHAGYIRLGVWW